MDDVVMRGDDAEYHWTLVGTNTAPGGTRRRVRISGFEVWKIGEDGLIAESLGHFDAVDYQRQLERGVHSRSKKAALVRPGSRCEQAEIPPRKKDSPPGGE